MTEGESATPAQNDREEPRHRHVTLHGRPHATSRPTAGHDTTGARTDIPQPQNDHLDTQRPGSRPGTAHPISPTPQATPPART